MSNRNLYNELDKMVKRAFNEQLTTAKVTPTMTTPIYESIEDYTLKTGKRFRQTKADKEAGLSREESFARMYGTEPTNQDSRHD